MVPEPPNVPGYTFVARSDISELCEFVYEDERILGPIRGANINSFCVVVGAIGAGTAFLTLGTSATASIGVPALICATGPTVCHLRNIIEKSTSCSDLLGYVYLADNLTQPRFNGEVLVLPACRNGAISEPVSEFADTAGNIGEEAVTAADNFVDGIYASAEDFQQDPLGSL